eukprot:5255761-Prymnesium_polylepis.2
MDCAGSAVQSLNTGLHRAHLARCGAAVEDGVGRAERMLAFAQRDSRRRSIRVSADLLQRQDKFG